MMKTAMIQVPGLGEVKVTPKYRGDAFGCPGYQIREEVGGRLVEGYASYSPQYHGEVWAIEACVAAAVRTAFGLPWATVTFA